MNQLIETALRIDVLRIDSILIHPYDLILDET